MTYVLATTEKTVRWYRIKTDQNGKVIGFELLDRLNLNRVTIFGDKKSANHVALAIGLKTWRYVKFLNSQADPFFF